MVTKSVFERMIAGAVARISEEHELLSRLDSVAGDGDHGTSMLRIVKTLQESFGPQSPPSLQECLSQAGWNVMEVDGGASSAILGALLMGMSEAPAGAELGAMFEKGFAAIALRTPARSGDKTMMDALVPAVLALSAAEAEGKSRSFTLKAAAEAAHVGAEATKAMVSKYGRARSAGTRTVGYPDPGATSIAFLFDGFYNGAKEFEEA